MPDRPKKLLLLVVVLWLSPQAAVADALVLVAGKDNPVTQLRSLDIRNLYLGFVVIDNDGRQLYALTNASDDHLMDVFLQNVMAMTQRSYNRRLLTLTVQSGRSRPPVYTRLDDLVQALSTDSATIACMWMSDAQGAENLRIVKILWRE